MTTPAAPPALPTEPAEVTAVGVFPSTLVDRMRTDSVAVATVQAEMEKLLRAAAYAQYLRLHEDGEFSFRPFVMDPAIAGDVALDHRGVKAWVTCVPWPDAGREPVEAVIARAEAERPSGIDTSGRMRHADSDAVGWPADMPRE